MDAAGIPKTWEELFYNWLAAKKTGKEYQTALGPLDKINVEDYFALSKGEPLSVVGRRRQNIRNLANKQIGNYDTYSMKGLNGTVGDDFEQLMRESFASQPGGADLLYNEKLLDLRYVADNYDELIDLGMI